MPRIQGVFDARDQFDEADIMVFLTGQPEQRTRVLLMRTRRSDGFVALDDENRPKKPPVRVNRRREKIPRRSDVLDMRQDGLDKKLGICIVIETLQAEPPDRRIDAHAKSLTDSRRHGRVGLFRRAVRFRMPVSFLDSRKNSLRYSDSMEMTDDICKEPVPNAMQIAEKAGVSGVE